MSIFLKFFFNEFYFLLLSDDDGFKFNYFLIDFLIKVDFFLVESFVFIAFLMKFYDLRACKIFVIFL